MAAERGEEERDPVQGFIDDAFEEMMRETGLLHKTGKYGKEPLAAALVEAAMTSLSRPASSRASELEKMLFTQALATALAEALAPALAEALAAEIVKVMNHHGAAEARGKEATAGSRARSGAGEGERGPESK